MNHMSRAVTISPITKNIMARNIYFTGHLHVLSLVYGVLICNSVESLLPSDISILKGGEEVLLQ